jgi:cleavage and polyadenylation specificity factor subunit 3
VMVVHVSPTEARIQWSSNTSHDMIADSTLALLLGIDSSPATVKLTTHSHSHSHSHSHVDDSEKLEMFLQAHFGDAARGEEMVIDVRVDGALARVDLISMVSGDTGRSDGRKRNVRTTTSRLG